MSANDFDILTDRSIFLVVDHIPPDTTESWAWGGQRCSARHYKSLGHIK